MNNNSHHTFENRRGNLNVSGNHNQIIIKNCALMISVNGNANNIIIEDSRTNIQINGNYNKFKNNRS
jgi:hypothetical protein